MASRAIDAVYDYIKGLKRLAWVGRGEAGVDHGGEMVDVADDALSHVLGATGDDGEDVRDHVFVAHDVHVVALRLALEATDTERKCAVMILSAYDGDIGWVEFSIISPVTTDVSERHERYRTIAVDLPHPARQDPVPRLIDVELIRTERVVDALVRVRPFGWFSHTIEAVHLHVRCVR